MLEKRKLDKSIPVPLYYQLKNLIYEEINAGSYKVGDAIPTENELSEMFGISRTTVRQAMTEMVSEGTLYRIKSKGTFIAERTLSHDFINKLQIFNEVVSKSGRTPSTTLISQDNEALTPAFFLDAMRIPVKTCIALHRRRFADDKPICHVYTWLHNSTLETVKQKDMSSTFVFRMLSESESTSIVKVVKTCSAVPANAEDADMLRVDIGTPVHCLESIGYNADGEAIMYSIARYRGDENRFTVTIEA